MTVTSDKTDKTATTPDGAQKPAVEMVDLRRS